jgi:hypothetical protein
MRLDKQNLLMDGLLIDTGTVVSTNSIDLYGAATAASNQVQGATTDTLGNTPPFDAGKSDIEILFQVTTAFATSTSVVFSIIMSANANLSSPTVLCSTPSIAIASLVPGYRVRLAVPKVGVTARYLGCQAVVTGSTGTGNVTAAIVGDDMSLATSPGSAV